MAPVLDTPPGSSNDHSVVKPASDGQTIAYEKWKDEFDIAYDEAQANNEPLPFGRFIRTDDHAYRFRDIRMIDPCTPEQVFRRRTADLRTGEILEDIYKCASRL